VPGTLQQCAPRSFPDVLVEWPTVYPWGIYNAGLDEATFRRKYRHQLHRKTPKVLAEVVELQEAYAPLRSCCSASSHPGRSATGSSWPAGSRSTWAN
jgi:hypothetical protein